MGIDYCTRCGTAHEPPRQKNCKRERVLTSRSTRQTSAMSQPQLDPEKPVEDGQMDDEERDLQLQVDAARAARRKLALKRALLELQADNIREAASQAAPPGGGDDPNSASGQPSGGTPGDGPWRDIPPRRDDAEDGKLKSKFDLSPYLEDKQYSKVSFPEHVLASMKWGVDYEWGSQEEVKGFLAHIGYVAMKTVGDLYIPSANMDYDKYIRKAAVNRGVKAFCGGNWDLSMEHYRYENTWQAKRETSRESGARGGYRGGNRGGSRGGRGYSHSPQQQQQQ